jgi:hypothetical protein
MFELRLSPVGLAMHLDLESQQSILQQSILNCTFPILPSHLLYWLPGSLKLRSRYHAGDSRKTFRSLEKSTNPLTSSNALYSKRIV